MSSKNFECYTKFKGFLYVISKLFYEQHNGLDMRVQCLQCAHASRKFWNLMGEVWKYKDLKFHIPTTKF